MNTFEQLKKQRNDAKEKLLRKVESLTNNQTYQSNDDRFWYPEVDKAGNGYAVIRFLPAPKGEEVPFVRIFNHGFKGPTGKWYIENSLTSLGQPDPVSEYNTKLWSTGDEVKQNQVRQQKRRLSYVSNIYVVKDPGKPENENKVYLYRYGMKIFDKLDALIHPKYPGDPSINPFDMWEGANLRLKIRTIGGFRNYDESQFESPSALLSNDADLEKIWSQEYSLQEFLAPKNFKSYDELKRKLYEVLDLQAPVASSATMNHVEDDMPELSAPVMSSSSEDSELKKFEDLINS